MSRPMYSIQVEGLDGTGKGQVIDILNNSLRLYCPIVNMKFPGGDPDTPEYEIIRSYAKSEDFYLDGRQTLLNLQNMDCAVLNRLNKRSDVTFIYDRFLLSTLVYDSLKTNPLGEEKITNYCIGKKHLKVDLTIYCQSDLNKLVEINSQKTEDGVSEKTISTSMENLKILNEKYYHYLDNNYSVGEVFYIDTTDKNFVEKKLKILINYIISKIKT